MKEQLSQKERIIRDAKHSVLIAGVKYVFKEYLHKRDSITGQIVRFPSTMVRVG